MAEQPAIIAEGLGKRFGRLQALAGVDLRVRAGAVVAVLGPNGAGKTTMVRILCTLLRPDSGRAAVAGLDGPGEPGDDRAAVRAGPRRGAPAGR